MGGGESPGVRALPHPDAVPRDAALPPNGIGRPPAASRLESLRYGARGIPPEAHVAGRLGARLRLVVRAPLFAQFHLAAQARRLACGSALSGNVLFIQAIEPCVAFTDQAR